MARAPQTAAMPTIETKYFGTMTYQEDSCFRFSCGLPAFEEEDCFVPVELPDHKPLVFLQSAKTPSLCFVALPILVADPDYKLSVAREDLKTLGLPAARQPRIGTEALVLTLLSVREGGPATANLLAPIVVNMANRSALQAIRCDRLYSHEQPLRSLAETNAC